MAILSNYYAIDSTSWMPNIEIERDLCDMEIRKLRKELEAKQKDNAGLIKKMEGMKKEFKVKRIIKSGNATIVFWEDGTKTIVKRASDEAESDYAAFTAAIGIKMFGSNSALKRVVARTETQKPRKEKKKPDADSNYDQRKTDEWLDSIERRTR